MTLPPATPASYVPAGRVPDLPPRAVEYEHVLRGPRHRWWRPLLSAVVLALAAVLGMIVVTVGAAGLVLVTGGDPPAWFDRMAEGRMTPDAFLFTNLTLIVLVPAVLLAVWIGHSVPARWVWSVQGRFRWRWFARCLAVLAPLWLALVGAGYLVDGVPEGGRPEQWGVLLVIVLLTTPLQCAGEEIAFRGWLLQSVGSWFPWRWVSVGVAIVLSAVGFGLAHGSLDPWTLAGLATFATMACLMTWRTGGLEAAIAAHTLNNVVVMVSSLVLGGFEQGFIDADTTSSWEPVLVQAAVQAAAYGLVVWQARRTGVQRLTTPQVPAPPTAYVPPVAPGPGAPAWGAPSWAAPQQDPAPADGSTPSPYLRRPQG